MSEQETLIVKRFDTFKLPKVKKNDRTGFLQGEVCATKADVFPYMNWDGSIRYELRHPDDVFKKDSLDTLKMLPFTEDHPQDWVTSDNAAALQKGYTGENYRLDGDNVIVSLSVTDKSMINKILSGKKAAVSLGYDTLLVREDGVYKGKKYTHRQTNIVYNHLAGVDEGNAGPLARFRHDSKQNIDFSTAECRIDENNLITVFEEKNMSDQDKVDTKNTDQALELQVARVDALTAEKSLLTNKLENLQARCDSVEKAWEETKEELNTLKAVNTEAEIARQVLDRTNLFVKAGAYLGDDFVTYLRHTDRQVMEAVLKQINSKKGAEVDFTGRNDEYVKGVFDSAVGNPVSGTARSDIKKAFGVFAKVLDSSNQEESTNDKLRELAKNFKEKK